MMFITCLITRVVPRVIFLFWFRNIHHNLSSPYTVFKTKRDGPLPPFGRSNNTILPTALISRYHNYFFFPFFIPFLDFPSDETPSQPRQRQVGTPKGSAPLRPHLDHRHCCCCCCCRHGFTAPPESLADFSALLASAATPPAQYPISPSH